MIERHFGESAAWSIGVEEEVMILDGDSLEAVPRAALVIADLARPNVKSELFASIVELATGVCAGPRDALEELRTLRRDAAASAAAHGLAVAAAGSHPFSEPVEQEIAADDRYRSFVAYAGVSARRQGVQGVHVHVGMPDADTCYQALEGVLPWLPLVLALSVNSPYLSGRATGLASNRAEVLAQLPRAGAPPAFAGYDEFELFVERLVRLGLAGDHTNLWWDVRPHPRLGTLEIRMPDQPTAVTRSGAFAALLQALCVAVLEAPPRPYDPAGRGIYQQNRWAALRAGEDAELVHPDEERLVPVVELREELLALVGPAAQALGTGDLLAPLREQSEGRRQLEIGRERGLRAVCADLVERTGIV